MENILYIFITHQGNIANCYERIKNMMKTNFIIVMGGVIKESYDENTRILRLSCNDGYAGLPEKVIKAFHYIITDKNFEKYDFFCKLDDDVVFIKPFDTIESDYLGCIVWGGNRKWHFGKCNNILDTQEYMGEFPPMWCAGGNGYILSRFALNKIVPNFDYNIHLYEDVYIASLLNEKGIKPLHFPDIRNFLFSQDH